MKPINDIIEQAGAGLAGNNEKDTIRGICYPAKFETAKRLLLEAWRDYVETETKAAFYLDQHTCHHAEQLAIWATEWTRKPWLLLYGGTPGTGKTSAAYAIKGFAERLRGTYEARAAASWRNESEAKEFRRWAAWSRVPELFTARDLALFAAGYHGDAELCPEGGPRLYEKCAGLTEDPYFDYSGPVIVDDIGTEPEEMNVFGTKITPIADLLARRYERRYPTIITANLGLESIADRYGARILDRLQEVAEFVEFGGESYRTQ